MFKNKDLRGAVKVMRESARAAFRIRQGSRRHVWLSLRNSARAIEMLSALHTTPLTRWWRGQARCAGCRANRPGPQAVGGKTRLHHEGIEARLGRIIEVDLKHEQLSWKINEDHLAQAQLMDGKLLLVTNVADLTPTEVVQRYKSLADIERGFHVLKSESESESAPMLHRLPDRIRAHALICLIALVLHRVMRMRLKATGSKVSPERALELLRQLQRQLQRHRVHLADVQTVIGLFTISSEQAELFTSLKLPRPSTKNL